MADSTSYNIGRCVISIKQLDSSGNHTDIPFFDENKMAHVKTVVESTINAPKIAVHTFQVSSPDYINSDLIPSLSTDLPFISFSLGIQSGKFTKWLPPERHIILNDTIQVLPDSTSGPLVSFRTADLLWLYGYSHVRVHKGPISDMVQAIWDILVGGTSQARDNTLIEPCINTGRGSTTDAAGVYYQSNDTDLNFLKTKLTVRARNTSQRSGYRFYVLDDYFHFHTPGYKQTAPKYLPYSNQSNGASNLEVSDRSVEYAQRGNSLVTAYAYNPLSGEFKGLDADPDNTAVFSTARGGYTGLVTMPVHVGQNLEIDELSKAQHLYSSYRNETYSASLVLPTNIDIRLGDIVDLQVAGKAGTKSAYSGLWEVQAHTFDVDNGTLLTKIRLGRGEIYVTSGINISDPNTGFTDTASLSPNLDPAASAGTPTSALADYGGTNVEVFDPETT